MLFAPGDTQVNGMKSCTLILYISHNSNNNNNNDSISLIVNDVYGPQQPCQNRIHKLLRLTKKKEA